MLWRSKNTSMCVTDKAICQKSKLRRRKTCGLLMIASHHKALQTPTPQLPLSIQVKQSCLSLVLDINYITFWNLKDPQGYSVLSGSTEACSFCEDQTGSEDGSPGRNKLDTPPYRFVYWILIEKWQLKTCVQICNSFLCFTVSSAQEFFWKTPCLELFRLHGKGVFLSALHYQKHQYCICAHLFGKQTAWPSTHLCSYHLLKAWAVLSIQKDERRYKVKIIHTGLRVLYIIWFILY